MRIARKLSLTFLAGSLFPLAILGGVLLREANRSLRVAALDHQKQAVEKAAEHVTEYLNEIRRLLGVLRGSADLQSPNRRSASLESVLNNGPMFSELALLALSGREIERLSRFQGEVSALFSNPSLALQEAQKHEVYFGPVHTSETGYPFLPFCTLMETPTGAPMGVLAGRLNLLDLSARLQRADAGKDALLQVYDTQKRRVAHSSAEDLFARANVPEGIVDPEKRLEARALVPELNWVVVLDQPESVVFAMVGTLRTRILWGLMAAGVVAFLLSVLVARSLVRPLSTIHRAVDDLSRGEFNTRLTGVARDEIGAVAARLREAQRVLEAKVRQSTVGLLVHRVGHDLRQPLAAIRESAAVIKRHTIGLDDTAKKHLGLIDLEIESGMESVEDLLTLGRERPPHPTVVNLNAMVRECVERMRPWPTGMEVAVRPGDETMTCVLDVDEIRRAVRNGIRNAFESGANRVTVMTEKRSGRGCLRVEDNGRGLPEAVRGRLFSDFFTTKSNGTGLGLGIIQRAVERSGGTVALENNPTGGAVLTLTFPLDLPPGGHSSE
jgi:signal transduction histidine kinase